jgi:hypothetical protein
MGSKIPFVALHNCAKHITYVDEAVESLAHLVDAVIQQVSTTTEMPHNTTTTTQAAAASSSSPAGMAENSHHNSLIRQQLTDRLRYRRTVLRSTQLRLSSLHRRTANTLTLAFNLVTQQDSTVMRQDSSAMKMIAGITMVFLPTTGVAAVVGSQLFIVEQQQQHTGSNCSTDAVPAAAGETRWSVTATPLFRVLWWIAIPLTVLVVLLGALWTWRAGVQEQVTRLKRRWRPWVRLSKGS